MTALELFKMAAFPDHYTLTTKVNDLYLFDVRVPCVNYIDEMYMYVLKIMFLTVECMLYQNCFPLWRLRN